MAGQILSQWALPRITTERVLMSSVLSPQTWAFTLYYSKEKKGQCKFLESQKVSKNPSQNLNNAGLGLQPQAFLSQSGVHSVGGERTSEIDSKRGIASEELKRGQLRLLTQPLHPPHRPMKDLKMWPKIATPPSRGWSSLPAIPNPRKLKGETWLLFFRSQGSRAPSSSPHPAPPHGLRLWVFISLLP